VTFFPPLKSTLLILTSEFLQNCAELNRLRTNLSRLLPPTETLTWGPPDGFQSWTNFGMTAYSKNQILPLPANFGARIAARLHQGGCGDFTQRLINQVATDTNRPFYSDYLPDRARSDHPPVGSPCNNDHRIAASNRVQLANHSIKLVTTDQLSLSGLAPIDLQPV